MNPRNRLTMVAAVCLGLATSSAWAGDPTIDACSLLTKSEVEQVLGKLKGAPKSDHIEVIRTCDYELTAASQALSVWVFPQRAMERARKEYKNVTPVKSLGQEAFIHADLENDMTEIFVLQGNATLKLSLPESKDSETKVQALARKAVARLK